MDVTCSYILLFSASLLVIYCITIIRTLLQQHFYQHFQYQRFFPEKSHWALGKFSMFAAFVLVSRSTLQVKALNKCFVLDLLFLFIVFVCIYTNFQQKRITVAWYPIKVDPYLYVDWQPLQNFSSKDVYIGILNPWIRILLYLNTKIKFFRICRFKINLD